MIDTESNPDRYNLKITQHPFTVYCKTSVEHSSSFSIGLSEKKHLNTSVGIPDLKIHC